MRWRLCGGDGSVVGLWTGPPRGGGCGGGPQPTPQHREGEHRDRGQHEQHGEDEHHRLARERVIRYDYKAIVATVGRGTFQWRSSKWLAPRYRSRSSWSVLEAFLVDTMCPPSAIVGLAAHTALHASSQYIQCGHTEVDSVHTCEAAEAQARGDAPLDAHEATLAPLAAPAVLQQPVVLARARVVAVPHDEHRYHNTIKTHIRLLPTHASIR